MKKYQDAINARRRQSQTFENANKKFAASKTTRQRNNNANTHTLSRPLNSEKANNLAKTQDNLTFSHMGVTNNIQSPNYFRKYTRPSETAANQKL